jgi:rhamnulokinase
MQLNTLYQLHAMKLSGSPALANAQTLLFMPDLFAYWLSGIQKAELTIASTSQFYNPVERRWATELLNRLGLPAAILPGIVEPGTRLGPLRDDVSRAAGLSSVTVFATASHDTASAVASVPAGAVNWCYISSGTWSLMGVELPAPIINDRTLAMNFTNEVGFGGSIRFLKNIAGMWPIQECRRAWAAAGDDYSYQQLTEMAGAAEPFLAAVDPDAFLEPGSMPVKIADYCRRTGQPVPKTPGQFCRVIFEGLALRYREVLENLDSLLSGDQQVIHIVGGGSKNRLLNQFVADSTGRQVVTGPVEATAAGNILIQAIGDGAVSDLPEARRIVRQSFSVETVNPGSRTGWDSAFDRFRSIARQAAV